MPTGKRKSPPISEEQKEKNRVRTLRAVAQKLKNVFDMVPKLNQHGFSLDKLKQYAALHRGYYLIEALYQHVEKGDLNDFSQDQLDSLFTVYSRQIVRTKKVFLAALNAKIQTIIRQNASSTLQSGTPTDEEDFAVTPLSFAASAAKRVKPSFPDEEGEARAVPELSVSIPAGSVRFASSLLDLPGLFSPVVSSLVEESLSTGPVQQEDSATSGSGLFDSFITQSGSQDKIGFLPPLRSFDDQ